MTVCRYFLKGYCRFGDRCRFEHTQPDYETNNYNERNTGNYQERHRRQEAGYSNYYHADTNRSNQRYEAKNYYDQRSYSPERYQENYRYQSPMASAAYENEYQYQHNKGSTYNHWPQPRYEEPNYGRNKQYSNNYQEESFHTQNRYEWLSDDYKKQNPAKGAHNNNYVQDSFKTSTPRAKTSFSFKVPESEIKKDNSSLLRVNEEEQICINMVNEDAKSWELGGQWPFTCYAPYTSKHGFPGFYDVSSEELRYAAYNAEKENSYELYLKSVQNALEQVNQQRSQLQVSTPQLLATLRKIKDGQDLYSTSKLINPLPSTGAGFETMETAAFSNPVKQAAAAFSFKMPTETDSAIKTSATNFSFKLPATTETNVVPQGVPDGDTNIFTPMRNLTEEEKQQFCASTFVLGKIPIRPPSQGLCT